MCENRQGFYTRSHAIDEAEKQVESKCRNLTTGELVAWGLKANNPLTVQLAERLHNTVALIDEIKKLAGGEE